MSCGGSRSAVRKDSYRRHVAHVVHEEKQPQRPQTPQRLSTWRREAARPAGAHVAQRPENLVFGVRPPVRCRPSRPRPRPPPAALSPPPPFAPPPPSPS